jgi:formate-nitrite transporter family protein
MTDPAGRDGSESDLGGVGGPTALKPTRLMLEQELQQAVVELERPLHGLVISGISAGLGVGISIFLIGAVKTMAAEQPVPRLVIEILRGSAYAIGFTIVILGRMDLFTEFTTLAILPVLAGRSRWTSLVRLWVIIYLGNLVGSAGFALAAVLLGPSLQVIDAHVLAEMGQTLVKHHWTTILFSATLAGWLMGVLSWLITGGRDTISQILFIWLIGLTIGLGHLHHVVTGNAEALAGLWAGAGFGVATWWHFIVWSTVGNAAGGAVFAISVRYSLRMRNKPAPDAQAQTS